MLLLIVPILIFLAKDRNQTNLDERKEKLQQHLMELDAIQQNEDPEEKAANLQSSDR